MGNYEYFKDIYGNIHGVPKGRLSRPFGWTELKKEDVYPLQIGDKVKVVRTSIQSWYDFRKPIEIGDYVIVSSIAPELNRVIFTNSIGATQTIFIDDVVLVYRKADKEVTTPPVDESVPTVGLNTVGVLDMIPTANIKGYLDLREIEEGLNGKIAFTNSQLEDIKQLQREIIEESDERAR